MPVALRAIAPMLASTASEVPAGDDWAFEPKYDGMRVLAYATRDDVRLVTRNGIDRAPQFPEVVHALTTLARRRHRSFVLDGEIIVRRVARGTSAFQALQARWHVSDLAAVARHANASPVDIVVFDVLVDGEERVTALPWHVRRKRLEAILRGPLLGGVRLGESAVGDGHKMLRKAARSGWEGIIAKRIDAPYRPGIRTRDWLKLKIVSEQEFVVGGWTEPRRSREHVGALLLGYWKDGTLVYAGHTGTGFSREALRDLVRRLSRIERRSSPFASPPRTNQKAHWTQPSTVVVVRFTEWTSDGKLRQPVFMGVRDDKNAAQVSREPMSMQKRVPRVVAASPNGRGAGSKAQGAGSKARGTGGAGKTVLAQIEQLERSGGRDRIRIDARSALEVSSLDKIYFPKARLTKGHVMRYYAAVAPVILPLIAERPLVLKRYPNGIDRAGAFFQQSAPANTPDGVVVKRVPTADGPEPRIVAGNLMTLLYSVQIGAIEVNPWASRIGSLNYADYAVLDLDPGDRAPFSLVVQVALWISEVLDELGIAGAVKTSGGRGMHIYLALPPRTSFTNARTAADIIAHHVAARHPAETTLVRALNKRPPNAVYIDVGQNDRGKSVAAPFSLRAREPGLVSTPLEWSELTPMLDPTTLTIDRVLPEAKRRATVWRRGLRRPIDMQRLTQPHGRRTRAKAAGGSRRTS